MHFLSIFFHEKGNSKSLKKVKNRRKLLLLSFSKCAQCFSVTLPLPRKRCEFCALNPRKMCKNRVIIPRKMCKFAEKNRLEWNEKPFSY